MFNRLIFSKLYSRCQCDIFWGLTFFFFNTALVLTWHLLKGCMLFITLLLLSLKKVSCEVFIIYLLILSFLLLLIDLLLLCFICHYLQFLKSVFQSWLILPGYKLWLDNLSILLNYHPVAQHGSIVRTWQMKPSCHSLKSSHFNIFLHVAFVVSVLQHLEWMRMDGWKKENNKVKEVYVHIHKILLLLPTLG